MNNDSGSSLVDGPLCSIKASDIHSQPGGSEKCDMSRASVCFRAEPAP